MNKACTHCSKEFPPTREYFYALKVKRGAKRYEYLNSWCKPCVRIMTKARSKEHYAAGLCNYCDNPRPCEKHMEITRSNERKLYATNLSVRMSARGRSRDYWHKAREEALRVYGGKCECCGETDPKLLTIDHTNNNGNKHRKEMGGNRIATWLRQHGWPKDGFRLLCYNCNMGRAFYGVCPHESWRLMLDSSDASIAERMTYADVASRN